MGNPIHDLACKVAAATEATKIAACDVVDKLEQKLDALDAARTAKAAAQQADALADQLKKLTAP